MTRIYVAGNLDMQMPRKTECSLSQSRGKDLRLYYPVSLFFFFFLLLLLFLFSSFLHVEYSIARPPSPLPSRFVVDEKSARAPEIQARESPFAKFHPFTDRTKSSIPLSALLLPSCFIFDCRIFAALDAAADVCGPTPLFPVPIQAADLYIHIYIYTVTKTLNI